MTSYDPTIERVVESAAAHGLRIAANSISFNDMGLDYRVGFATAIDGLRWVLRLPRRPGVMEQAKNEARVLALLATRLPFAVPEWKIFSDVLIAYPMLPGHPGLTFDTNTYETTWHFDKDAEVYIQTLGASIAALHAIDTDAARSAGMPDFTPTQVRQKWLSDLDLVGSRFEVVPDRMIGLRNWVLEESYWPNFSVPIHGDLYVGHVMVEQNGAVRGVIDWTEARIADPAVDLVGHLKVFGEDSFTSLLVSYRAAGGRTWPRIVEHCQFIQKAIPITYAIYALATGESEHRAAAQEHLLAGL